MLNPVFWLSFAAVFLAIRWLADGWMAAATVEVRARRAARGELATPASPSSWPTDLDQAA